MTISQIQAMPTSVREIPIDCAGIHESCLRAFQILAKVENYLRRNVPADVILELIAEMEEVRKAG